MRRLSVPRRPRSLAATLVLALGPAAACQQATSVSVRPSPSPSINGSSVVVVTIDATGMDPQTLHILGGSVVAFVNHDVRTHEVRSDPHPAHTECALMNLDPVPPGGMVQTRPIAVGQGCGFHDEVDPTNPHFQGFALGH